MPPQYLELQSLIQSTDLFSPEKRQELLEKLPDFMPITVKNIIKEIQHYEEESTKLDNHPEENRDKQIELYRVQYQKIMEHIHTEEKQEWEEHGKKALAQIEHDLEQL